MFWKRRGFAYLLVAALAFGTGAPAYSQVALIKSGTELVRTYPGIPQLAEALENIRHAKGATLLRARGAIVAEETLPYIENPAPVLEILYAADAKAVDLSLIQSPALRRALSNGRFRQTLIAGLEAQQPSLVSLCGGPSCPLGNLEKSIDDAARAATRPDPTDLASVAVSDEARWFGRLNEVGEVNTTSLRRESKFVRPKTTEQPATGFAADNADLKRIMRGRTVPDRPLLYPEGMQEFFGDGLKLRDQVAEGTLNETYTTYARPIKFEVVDPETGDTWRLVAKYRNRQYRVVNERTGSLMERAPITEESQFAEFKVDALVPGVVTKHRFLAVDNDIEILRDPSRFWGALRRQIASPIERRIIGLGGASEATIQQMLKTIDLLHANGTALEPFVDVAYVRDAYELSLESVTGETVKVQITIDRNIRYLDPATHNVIGTYPPGSRVVEVKVPLQYAGLTEADMAEVPGLARVKEFSETVESASPIDGFIDGNGKFINFRKNNFVPAAPQ